MTNRKFEEFCFIYGSAVESLKEYTKCIFMMVRFNTKNGDQDIIFRFNVPLDEHLAEIDERSINGIFRFIEKHSGMEYDPKGVRIGRFQKLHRETDFKGLFLACIDDITTKHLEHLMNTIESGFLITDVYSIDFIFDGIQVGDAREDIRQKFDSPDEYYEKAKYRWFMYRGEHSYDQGQFCVKAYPIGATKPQAPKSP